MFSIFLMSSVMFLFSYHPLSMGLVLIFMLLVSSFFVYLVVGNAWLSYIFILIFLGGLLILFIYVASLASNEPVSLNYSWTYFIGFCFLVPMMEFIVNFWGISMQNLFYLSEFSVMVLFLACYLLLGLVVVIKLVRLDMGPLRELVYGVSS